MRRGCPSLQNNVRVVAWLCPVPATLPLSRGGTRLNQAHVRCLNASLAGFATFPWDSPKPAHLGIRSGVERTLLSAAFELLPADAPSLTAFLEGGWQTDRTQCLAVHVARSATSQPTLEKA